MFDFDNIVTILSTILANLTTLLTLLLQYCYFCHNIVEHTAISHGEGWWWYGWKPSTGAPDTSHSRPNVAYKKVSSRYVVIKLSKHVHIKCTWTISYLRQYTAVYRYFNNNFPLINHILVRRSNFVKYTKELVWIQYSFDSNIYLFLYSFSV